MQAQASAGEWITLDSSSHCSILASALDKCSCCAVDSSARISGPVAQVAASTSAGAPTVEAPGDTNGEAPEGSEEADGGAVSAAGANVEEGGQEGARVYSLVLAAKVIAWSGASAGGNDTARGGVSGAAGGGEGGRSGGGGGGGAGGEVGAKDSKEEAASLIITVLQEGKRSEAETAAAGSWKHMTGKYEVVKQVVITNKAAYATQEIFGNEEDEDQEECVICLSDPKDTILMPWYKFSTVQYILTFTQ